MSWIWQGLGVCAGALIVGAGFYVMRFGRTRGRADHRAAGEAGGAEEPGVLWGASVTTRLVAGLSLAVAGYHLVSYALPAGWLYLRVPSDRLWILGVVLAVSVCGSLVLDRVERRG